MGTALARIRSATAELHRQLDGSAYARALLEGSLPIERYASFLRATWIVHTELEQALERAPDPRVRSVVDAHFFARRGLLEKDLAHLQLDLEQADAAALQAVVLAQTLRLATQREPRVLLGHAYVLEGSQLGGLVQACALQKHPELQQGGLSYLTGAGSQTRALFESFVGRLEAALPDEPALLAAIEGAEAAFAGFHDILGAVDPARFDEPWLAAELNAEAGMHAVPEQLREVQAALFAGELSYRQVPYYWARYGERGLRYTRSDSAWLVTLARQTDQAQTLQHVHWLGRVLAARGMPRVLLEWHLERLHDALVTALPEHAPAYRRLALASQQLRSERYQMLPNFDALSGSFASDLGKEATIPALDAASLVLGAVADEKRGVPKAVSSLTSWLLDPVRFSASWIRALEQLMHSARSA